MALRATGLFSEVSGVLSDKAWGIKNTSDNGIDIVTKPKYGDYANKGGWYGYEVKASGTSRAPDLNEHQKKGAAFFMKSRIDDLAAGCGEVPGVTHIFQFYEKGPLANDFLYCPYCAKKIIECNQPKS